MKKLLLYSLISIILLSGCHVAADQNSVKTNEGDPKAVVGDSVVSGKLINSKGKSLPDTSISLAQIYRQNGKAAFVLDSGNSPSTMTDKKGSFTFTKITSGEYILVIGNPMSSYQIYSLKAGEPEIFVVEPGKNLQVGTLKIIFSK